MNKIIVVEDDDNIRDLECYALTSSGFEAIGFPDGEGLYQELKAGLPDLLILDIMLPNDDGLAILKHMKSNVITKDIPVIMVTAKTNELDRVKGLDLGADDYISKPFSVLELVSRVKAVLRRCQFYSKEENIITIKNLVIDADRRRVTVGGDEVLLTYKEFELLYYLAMNRGLVLSRDKIMESIWGFEFEGESRTVDMHIKTLRQKLLGAGEAIKTVRSVGYKIEE